ncbi:MAG: hypothetical protein ACREQM_13880 [Candidatus Dormibacteraceae bacterium]
MATSATAPDGGARRLRPTLKRRHVFGTGSMVTLAILLVGSYVADWRWTGFKANGTLWDWLHLLILPVAVGTLPLWFSTRKARRRSWMWPLLALLVAFAVVAVGGYGFSWAWTGFRGNTLWDWLQLLLVPVILPFAVFWALHREEEEVDAEVASEPEGRESEGSPVGDRRA